MAIKRITNRMINAAENRHFINEDRESWEKENALKAIQAKQRGETRYYKIFARLTPKKVLEETERRYNTRGSGNNVRRNQNVGNFRNNIVTKKKASMNTLGIDFDNLF